VGLESKARAMPLGHEPMGKRKFKELNCYFLDEYPVKQEPKILTSKSGLSFDEVMCRVVRASPKPATKTKKLKAKKKAKK
jgi:hypothetical protein